MDILFDTCSFLWLTLEPDKIPATVMAVFKDVGNTVYLSSVSSWEITLKYQVGKLSLPEPPEIFLPEARKYQGIISLDLTEKHISHLGKLPAIHKDPFDRILICQAIENGLTIVTPDEHTRQYPVKSLW